MLQVQQNQTTWVTEVVYMNPFKSTIQLKMVLLEFTSG